MARKKTMIAAVAALASLASPVIRSEPADAYHAYPGVNVQPPCSGYFDKFGVSHPSSHPIYKGSDLSMDWYCWTGTAVQMRAWPVSQQGAVRYYVAEKTPSCANGRIGDGGWSIRVSFYYNGIKIGHAWYFHLMNLQVTPGYWYPHGKTIGYTSRFPNGSTAFWSNGRRYDSRCYQVSSNGGAHTHFELYSTRHYACYINYRSGTWVDYWRVVGKIGGEYANMIRRPCP